MSAVHEIGAALMRRLPPETAHRATLWALSRGLGPHPERADDPVLAIELWGRRFANPIGIAAGFDKNAVAMGALAALGVGFVEVGGVTPEPQPGNPRPRLFRLPADQAVINRMGFNSDGAEAVVARLAAGRAAPGVPVGVNLAANTESADPARDFERLVRLMGPLADFLTVDISCPNTANGQLFLSPVPLRELLARLADCRPAETALLVKLSPDVTEAGLEALVEVIANARVDGIVVCNTTRSRPSGLRGRLRREGGGLSGRPLFHASTEMLRRVYRLTGGGTPLVGVGGVASGADAYAKVRAGASLVQLYTALVFHGPGLIGRIKTDLAARLRADGFSSMAEAAGADHQ